MINGYDFDGTIYDGDSSVDFYKFCLKKNKKILLNAPIQIWGICLYILGIIDKTSMKEKIFSFLKRIDNVDDYIKEFWTTHKKNIKKWYLDQQDKTDLIISASPEFLLKPLEKEFNFHVIASKVNKKTGKFEEKNCHDSEKVRRYNEVYKNKTLKAFYSDSMSDKPMMDISEEAYFVKKNTIYDLKEDREGKLSKCMKMDKWLYKIGLLYLVIPILIQLVYWYNRLISIPCALLLLFATYKVMKKYKPLEQEEYYRLFQKKKILFFILGIIIMNVLSGAGGFFPQNWDYNGRNAIFRDLIENAWPVRYDYTSLPFESGIFGNGGILNYYFTYWLPGALVGKVTDFRIASIFMLFWQTLGVSIFFYYVCRFFRNIKYRYFVIFLAFGGLNVIGHIIMNKYWGFPISPIGVTHIDTSMGIFCMSTFITQLFWVFNQSIPAWIAVMLFLQEKDYKTCGFYFAVLVPYAPFPMLGFLYLIGMYILFGKKFDKLIDLKRIKELITIPNFFACISVLPIVFMFSLNESKKGCFLVDAIQNGNLSEVLLSYGLFVLLEFFVYIIIINKKNWKPLMVCFAFFAIAPLFYIGGSDLGNRATIPLLIVLYLLVVEYLDKINKKNKTTYLKQKIVIGILVIASVTNFNEFYRAIEHRTQNKNNGYSNFADAYVTFKNFEGKEVSQFITNFVAKDDQENKVLQWLLRK